MASALKIKFFYLKKEAEIMGNNVFKQKLRHDELEKNLFIKNKQAATRAFFENVLKMAGFPLRRE